MEARRLCHRLEPLKGERTADEEAAIERERPAARTRRPLDCAALSEKLLHVSVCTRVSWRTTSRVLPLAFDAI